MEQQRIRKALSVGNFRNLLYMLKIFKTLQVAYLISLFSSMLSGAMKILRIDFRSKLCRTAKPLVDPNFETMWREFLLERWGGGEE